MQKLFPGKKIHRGHGEDATIIGAAMMGYFLTEPDLCSFSPDFEALEFNIGIVS